MDKKEAIKIIVQCAKQYQKSLLNQNVMFVYYEKKYNKYCFFEATFLASNFCHLTGVICNAGLAPNDFFEKCIQHRLSPEDFEMRKDGTTKLKLDVLPSVIQIHKVSNMTGDYDKTGIQLYTEKLAGNIKGCMGFVRSGNYFVPNTLLNQDIRDVTRRPQHRIVAAFSKGIKDKEYVTLCYIAKGFDIAELQAYPAIMVKVNFEKMTEE